MSCEITALEAMRDVLRLEDELALAIEGVCRLTRMIEAQRVELTALNAVRVTAQRETAHWQERWQAASDELRWTAARAKMS